MVVKNLGALAIGVMLSLGAAGTAYSAGCLKGAIIGGITGHFAGHHGLLGAAAGCAIVHHSESKQYKNNSYNPTPNTNSYPYAYPNQTKPNSTQPSKAGVNYY